MEALFQDLFPPGFWKTVALSGTVVFFILALDLVLGAKLLTFLGQTMNKKVQVDQAVVNLLSELKKKSDTEVAQVPSLTSGIGRFVVSGLLFFGGALMLVLLVPRLH